MTTKLEQAFTSLEWHDALLLIVTIDRREPGERDEVVLIVEWPDGPKQQVRFSDCYALDAQMNFGVATSDSILTVDCMSNHPKLAELRRKWSAVSVDLGDVLCFEITMNLTASVIRIFARQFEVTDVRLKT
jgi:hypothetical protein